MPRRWPISLRSLELGSQLFLLGQELLPFAARNRRGAPINEADGMATVVSSFTVVTETDLVPEECEPQVSGFNNSPASNRAATTSLGTIFPRSVSAMSGSCRERRLSDASGQAS